MKILKFFLCITLMLACILYVPNYKIYEAFGDQLQLKRQAKGLQHFQKENSTLISQKEKEPDHDEEKITKKAITMVKTKIILLSVPLINQMDRPALYNGCEVTSLAMLLNYKGIRVTKNELARKIAHVPLKYPNGEYGNPNIGFVGNMETGPGLAVYHAPILKLARKYVGSRAKDLTNKPFAEILKKIDQRLPVWVITTSNFIPVTDLKLWKTPKGKMYITFSEHSVVITGYDNEHIYLNNPYGIKNQKVDKKLFVAAWEQMGKQAIVLH